MTIDTDDVPAGVTIPSSCISVKVYVIRPLSEQEHTVYIITGLLGSDGTAVKKYAHPGSAGNIMVGPG